MNLAEPLLGMEDGDAEPTKDDRDGIDLEPSVHSVSGHENVEALPHPVSARTARVPPPPQGVAATSAKAEEAATSATAEEGEKAAGRVSGGSGSGRGAAETKPEEDGGEDGDEVLGRGEGYYTRKFSKFYNSFVATTSSAATVPRTSPHHPLASTLDVPEIEGDVDGMPGSPAGDDDEDDGSGGSFFARSTTAPLGSLGMQREKKGAGARGETFRRSASVAGPMAFGAGRGRPDTFKRSESFGATALGPARSGGGRTVSPMAPRANTAAATAWAGGRSVGRPRVASRFSASRAVTAAKASELFAEPLASEGAGSVFPTDLPWAKRVAFEVEFIQKFDKLTINPNVGEFWMLIDADWVSRWAAFVLGQAEPPGPVSNRRLFGRDVSTQPGPGEEDTEGYPARRLSHSSIDTIDSADSGGSLLSPRRQKIRPGLRAIKDYRAIRPVVWFIFREIYDTDGAPDLCRTKLDVYSPEVLASRRARILEPSHTEAIYQLRRVVARIKRDMLAEKERQEAKKAEMRGDGDKKKGGRFLKTVRTTDATKKPVARAASVRY